MKRHVSNKHNLEVSTSNKVDKKEEETKIFHNSALKSFKCGICDVQGTKPQLDLHYIDAHEININVENITFVNSDTFQEWKCAIEKENHCKYIAACGRKQNSERYICHRSGEFKSKSKGLRSLKKQGSKKIGSYCPSKIIVRKYGDMCDVTFVKTHIGHENELCHVTLSNDMRAKIAHRLSQKIPPVIVLEEIKNSMAEKNDRIHLLTMKDLHNISKEFRINYECKTETNNDVNLEKFLTELRTSTNDTSVLYHKPHGEIDHNYSEIQSDDFILIIMNEQQNELLRRYGKNILILDRTAKTSYNLHLLTFFVLNENNQAFPCCFMFTNRDDESRLKTLFTILQSKCGTITTDVLMSCTSEQFHKTWTSIMGTPRHHVYSPWSVTQTWRNNITKIKNSEKQREVTDTLKKLLDEADSKKFPILLNEFVEKITKDETSRQFGQYFCKYFLHNVIKWAHCYHLQIGVPDITEVEKASTVIKCIYYNIKKNGGLSDCILFLYRFLRDKLFNKCVRYSKEEKIRRQQRLQQRHMISASKTYSITANEEDSWIITSTNEKSVNEVKSHITDCHCEISCDVCNVCIHRYVCSCTDSSIEWNMCDHIHFLCTNLQLTGDDNIIIVNDTVTFANDSIIGFDDSNDMTLNNYCFSNDECYDDDDEEEEEIVEVPDNQTEISTVLEINSLMDEIIVNMVAPGSGSFVIGELKKILNTLKTSHMDTDSS